MSVVYCSKQHTVHSVKCALNRSLIWKQRCAFLRSTKRCRRCILGLMYSANSKLESQNLTGALTIGPPTKWPRDISTQTKRPPDKPPAVTIYYVTFCLKVDGSSIHLKLWHSNLVNLDDLSLCDKPTHCNILSQSLTFCPHYFIPTLLWHLMPLQSRSIFPKHLAILLNFSCDDWSSKGRVWA